MTSSLSKRKSSNIFTLIIYSGRLLVLLVQAVLKIGRLIVNDLRSIPARCEMPTTAELKSFRLELCVAPRPTPVTINDAEVTIRNVFF